MAAFNPINNEFLLNEFLLPAALMAEIEENRGGVDLPPPPPPLMNEIRDPSRWIPRDHFLAFNSLSAFWTWNAIEEASPERIAKAAGLYALGIVGYALALPFRVCVLAKELFRTIGAFGKNITVDRGRNFSTTMKEHLLCLAGATVELFSGVIGLLCPVLAYWIDEKVQENPTINNHSSIRGRWMPHSHGSGRPRPRPTVDINRALWEMGDIDRPARRVEINALDYIKPHLQAGVRKLDEYFQEPGVLTTDFKTSCQIHILGLSLAFQDSSSDNFLRSMRPYAPRERGINFGNHKTNFKAAWSALIGCKYTPEQLADFLIYKAIDALKTEYTFKPGKEVRLQEELAAFSDHINDFTKLYDALNGINNAFLSSDAELVSFVMRESDPESE